MINPDTAPVPEDSPLLKFLTITHDDPYKRIVVTCKGCECSHLFYLPPNLDESYAPEMFGVSWAQFLNVYITHQDRGCFEEKPSSEALVIPRMGE